MSFFKYYMCVLLFWSGHPFNRTSNMIVSENRTKTKLHQELINRVMRTIPQGREHNRVMHLLYLIVNMSSLIVQPSYLKHFILFNCLSTTNVSFTSIVCNVLYSLHTVNRLNLLYPYVLGVTGM